MTLAARRGRGPGRPGLTELARLLSPRDWAVLEELQRYRFLTSGQIQRLLFADHASTVTGARTCRRTLGRLHAYRLVERLGRRVGGVYGGSDASVWAISSTGARLRCLRRGEGAAVRFREPSPRFVDHYLAIASTMLAIIEAARAGRFELGRVQLEPDCWRRYLGSAGARESLEPDLYVVTASGEYEDHWFLEVDTGSEHPPTVLRKCRVYEAYRATGTEQQATGVFPRVLWVVPSQARAEKLRAALQAARLDKALFRVVLADQLVEVMRAGGEA